jgi:hypothetical protein
VSRGLGDVYKRQLRAMMESFSMLVVIRIQVLQFEMPLREFLCL